MAKVSISYTAFALLALLASLGEPSFSCKRNVRCAVEKASSFWRMLAKALYVYEDIQLQCVLLCRTGHHCHANIASQTAKHLRHPRLGTMWRPQLLRATAMRGCSNWMLPNRSRMLARGCILLAVSAKQRCHCDPEHDPKHYADHNDKYGSRSV